MAMVVYGMSYRGWEKELQRGRTRRSTLIECSTKVAGPTSFYELLVILWNPRKGSTTVDAKFLLPFARRSAFQTVSAFSVKQGSYPTSESALIGNEVVDVSSEGVPPRLPFHNPGRRVL